MTVYQNVWDVAKAMLSGKLIAVSTCIKQERSHINSLSSQHKKLDKELNSKQVEHVNMYVHMYIEDTEYIENIYRYVSIHRI